MTKNETMLNWVGEMRELVQPDQVVWIDGSQEQLEALRAKACNDGDLIKLNQEKLPGCYLHRTALNDVARVGSFSTILATTGSSDTRPDLTVNISALDLTTSPVVLSILKSIFPIFDPLE